MTKLVIYLTIIGGIVSILGVFMRLAWLLAQIDARARECDETLQDHETRIRDLERTRREPRRHTGDS